MAMPLISALDFTSANMVDETIPDNTPMRNFYRDKTIFLTGGTGFLGQIFTEKLLRCRVKQIYLLARAKKNKTPLERINEIFDGVLFKKLKLTDPNYLNRIHLIEGDTSKSDLGITNENRKEIIENVEIVLHAAAEVRFDKTLQELCFTNVRGTREIIALTEQIKKLIVFAYVSTSFSHHYQKMIEEKFYPPPMDPEQVIQIVEHFSNNQTDDLVYLTEKLIEPWCNTYIFTKALAEELVRRAAYKIPTVVIRPSIIIATNEDPIPGWCNNFYGLNGITVGICLGFIRVCNYDVNKKSNVVCADFVTNGTLAVIWNKATEKDALKDTSDVDESKIIYHITANDQIIYGEMLKLMLSLFREYPSNKSMWLPRLNTCSSSFMFFILTILYHVCPALIFDLFFKFTDHNIRLLPMYRKYQEFTQRATYFVTKEWNFLDNNMKTVIAKMTKHDNQYFPCDVRRFDFVEYGYSYLWGLRTYMSKEPIDNMDDAKKRFFKLFVAHCMVLVVYYAVIICFIYFILHLLGINHKILLIFNSQFTVRQTWFMD